MYYWEIKWKSYSAETLLISDKQKEYIEAEWIKDPERRKSQTFRISGELYSYGSIDSITRTDKKVTDDHKLLYASEASLRSRRPMINADGDAVTNWYKKLVSNKSYDNYYGRHPSYVTLDKETGGIWIAFRIVEKENGERPEGIEQCTEGEVSRLWAKFQKTASY